MYFFAIIARQAKRSGFFRAICLFLSMQCLLSLPIMWLIARTEPHILYTRIHGLSEFKTGDAQYMQNIILEANENGFISKISILEENTFFENEIFINISFNYEPNIIDFPSFIITPEYFFYVDLNSNLAVPNRLVPAWVLEEANFGELFNHLALYNRYFTGIAAPVFAFVFAIFFVSQVMMYAVAVWLFGHWAKFSGALTIKERFSICAFATVPAAVIGFFFGLVAPVIHIFIAQLLMIYFTYKAIKEYIF